MMYYYHISPHIVTGEDIINITLVRDDGSLVIFQDNDGFDGPERRAYQQWVSEGNVAEAWDHENPQG